MIFLWEMMQMTWNLVPQYTALLFAAIIWIYSREDNVIPTLKNRLFRMCLRMTVLSMVFVIAALTMNARYGEWPIAVLHAVNILALFSTVLVTLTFLQYSMAVIWENEEQVYRNLKLAAIPAVLCAGALLSTPATGFIYSFTAPWGYMPGPGFGLVNAISILHLAAMVAVILLNRKKLQRSLFGVLLSFPLLGLTLALVQEFYLRQYMLSGVSTTASLLIVYLYLQNKRIVVDDLTGLQNRTAFRQVLQLRLQNKQIFHIIIVSLDSFKAVNDKFGQTRGDGFLQSVSRYLTDIVPIKYIYRISGDEFGIILENKDSSAVQLATTAIHNRFREPWETEGVSYILSASIAVAAIPVHAGTLEEVISLLEHCTHRSKTDGKGKVVYADGTMVSKAHRKRRISEALEEAIVSGGFTVHYQPVYCVREDRFTSAEALLRLDHPDFGSVSPGEFIPIAEEAGLMGELFYLVLDRVCSFLRLLEQKNISIDAVSINCSVPQIFQENLAENILRITETYGIDANKICLEITENTFAERNDLITGIMYDLGQHGIQFYLDDFGTGYSNLSTVVKLPFEFIKIDKNLVYEATASQKSLSVMKGLAAAFAESGMKVIIEGVETDAHREIAATVNADYIQGFLYARPMPEEEAAACLQQGRFSDGHNNS